MNRSKATQLIFVAAAAVLLAGAAFSANTAFAAKGGRTTGGGTATCSTTPASPIAFGSAYTLSGSGVPADAYLNVLVQSAAGLSSYNPPNVNGTWTLNLWAEAAGSYVVTVQQMTSSRFTVAGGCSYSVSP